MRYSRSILVDEDKMVVVRRVFRMVGAEGMVLNAARCVLEKEGIPTPSGRRVWSRQYLRDCIYDDAYLSHTFEEISRLVTPEVASGGLPRLIAALRGLAKFGEFFFHALG